AALQRQGVDGRNLRGVESSLISRASAPKLRLRSWFPRRSFSVLSVPPCDQALTPPPPLLRLQSIHRIHLRRSQRRHDARDQADDRDGDHGEAKGQIDGRDLKQQGV